MERTGLLFSIVIASLAIVFLASCREAPEILDEMVPARSAGGAESAYPVRGHGVEVERGGGDADSSESAPVVDRNKSSEAATGHASSEAATAHASSEASAQQASSPAAAQHASSDAAAQHASTESATQRASEPKRAVGGESLYAAGTVWTNQNGERMRLSDFGGRPVLVSMVFTRCSYACPMIIRDIKRMGEQLPDPARDEAQYVLVSLDPERDTPEVLRQFAEGHALDLDRWTLLTGDASQVRLLAALLGVRYRAQSDGQIAHTSLVTLLNDRGEAIHQQKGLGGEPSFAEDLFAR